MAFCGQLRSKLTLRDSEHIYAHPIETAAELGCRCAPRTRLAPPWGMLCV